MKKKLHKHLLPALLFIFAAIAAVLFIMPTVLTITNSGKGDQCQLRCNDRKCVSG